jgi:3-deoxy-manno-octulosonate cytidylyltransferase (CMP-KDO synthetase)
MYAYRGAALADYAGWRMSPAERFSGLEQLRWLVEGKRVAALPLAPMPGGAWPEVNYPADVAVVEAALRARGEVA